MHLAIIPHSGIACAVNLMRRHSGWITDYGVTEEPRAPAESSTCVVAVKIDAERAHAVDDFAADGNRARVRPQASNRLREGVGRLADRPVPPDAKASQRSVRSVKHARYGSVQQVAA